MRRAVAYQGNEELKKCKADLQYVLDQEPHNKRAQVRHLIYLFYIIYYRFIVSDRVVVVVDLPLLRVAVEGSDNPVSLEKPCQASLPPDQQGRHSLGRQPEVQYVA